MKKEDLIRSLKSGNFSPKIVQAFEQVDRKKYIPDEFAKNTYSDIPIPIGFEQTTSQPYTIAFMLTLLEIDDGQKILEVGSGSGYVLDLMSKINKKGKIFGIERIKELVDRSTEALKEDKNVLVIYGDGFSGFKAEAPYDRIIVSAECKDIPQGLISQLKFKGILVVPVNGSLAVLKKESGMNKVTEHPGFEFVPLKRGIE